ncbi:MAG: DNA polymerase III subunit alpha, partial [Verrucomicrobiota bacterium]
NELNITLKGFDKKDKTTGETKHEPGAIDKNPELKKAVETEPAVAQLWGYATVLEGLTRNTGVHAAGVVISDQDLSEYIPLTRGNEGGIVSQYSMAPLGDLGMLKMDFLGLKTLTVITDAVALIRKKLPEFDIDTIPLNDRKTFDIYNRGETIAIFQVESGGMVNVCRQFDVNDIEDINAILALYRPGPMDLIPQYIKRKKGLEKIKYLHPLLEKVTGETYGILVYQEQVMQAVQVLGGYTLGGADLLRRAMGKKDVEKMAKERQHFVEGCERVNQIPEKKANEIFDLLEKFAGYGFNRSHSAAYAWVSYQTGYLKANHPVEFMAAVLSNEISNTDKISVFVGECQRMGIAILPPDVNHSSLKFSPENNNVNVDGTSKSRNPEGEPAKEESDNGTPAGEAADKELRDLEVPSTLLGGIRFGLAAIKNVGEAAMEAAIAERERSGPFKSLEDFCKRVDPRKINKKVLESLVKCGAFDFTGEYRSALFAEIDGVLAASASSHRDRAAGQVSLFDDLPAETVTPKRASAAVPPWPQAEMLAYEKELLGFYVTGHPLDEYRSVLEGGKYRSILSLFDEMEDKEKLTVQVAGALTVVEKKFTKKDSKPFAIVTLEDLTGSLEVMIWNDAYNKCAMHLEQGRVVAVTGRLDKREDTPRIVATEIKPIKPGAPVMSPESAPVVLFLQRDRTSEETLQEIKSAVEQFPGSQKLELEFINTDGGRVRMKASQGVRFSSELREKLAPWLVK